MGGHGAGACMQAHLDRIQPLHHLLQALPDEVVVRLDVRSHKRL